MANIPPMDEKMGVALFEPVEASVDDGGEIVGAGGKATSMLLQPVELQHMMLEYISFKSQFQGNASNSILILSFAAFMSVLEREQNKDSDHLKVAVKLDPRKKGPRSIERWFLYLYGERGGDEGIIFAMDHKSWIVF